MNCSECNYKNKECKQVYTNLKGSVSFYHLDVVSFIAQCRDDDGDDELLELLIDLKIRDNCYLKYAQKLSDLYIDKIYLSDKNNLQIAILDYFFGLFGNPEDKKLTRYITNYKYNHEIYTVHKDFSKKQNDRKNDRKSEVNTRLTQSKFRNSLFKLYDRCALCGVTDNRVLNSSHIKPWSECTPIEKTNKFNGLLLCCNHDRLFDRGLISFNDDGHVLISNSLSKQTQQLLNLQKDMSIKLFKRNLKYMQYHRENIFIE